MNGTKKLNYFNTTQLTILSGTDVLELLINSLANLLTKIEDFQEMGSGWIVTRVLRMDVHVSKYRPLKGNIFVPLPLYLRNKHAVLNVKNKDNKCFLWAILSALHPVEYGNHADRVSHYTKYLNELPWQQFEMPMNITEISRFEKESKLSINLYDYNNKVLAPLYLSKHEHQRSVNLLLFQGHYCWIKNLDGLLRDQNKHNGLFYCPSCLFAFKNDETRREHFKRCKSGQHTVLKMPAPEENKLTFRNVHRQLQAPLIIYADFECLTEQLTTSNSDFSESYTRKYQRHTPCGVGLMPIKRSHGDVHYGDFSIYRGKDVIHFFLDKVIEIAENHHKHMKMPIDMSKSDWHKFDHATTCHICNKPLETDRVRDHCHINGAYRGAAHYKCNVSLRLNKDVTVAMHNLRRYDGHIIMSELGKFCESRSDLKIEAVAKNMEDYISFSIIVTSTTGKRTLDGQHVTQIYKIRFIDSCQFLPSSLEALVNNLAPEEFCAMQHHFSGSEIAQLTRKQVYPYDYMSAWDKFDEDMLPQREDFFNILTQSHISQDDYEHAKKIWNAFSIKNLGEYHDLYLKTDVLLLADVFERFRNLSLKHYGLDPVHYITLPAFSLDAMLRKTGATPDLLTDPDMYAFFEAGIRGGISVISHRYARANNMYLKDYNPSIPSSYIIYLDVNNLYGKAMTEKLPYKKFEWMASSELDQLNLLNIPHNSKIGYVVEVDLEYPSELHSLHNSFPLAPEKITVRDDMLSNYARGKKTINSNQPKLIPNLMNKYKYIVHHQTLQVYLKYGLKLKKIHRGVKFIQRAWMKPYIEFNTIMRQQACSCSEKDFFKLMNNAVFGKTMENVRNYRDVKLVTNQDKLLKLVASPRYLESSTFSENLVAVHMSRRTMKLDKPIYCGFTILDLSKIYMVNYHYGYTLPMYGPERATVLMMDTDSFILRIDTEDIYKDMGESKEQFDFSNYPANHRLFTLDNKQVLGKMKDETGGIPIREFVGLRPKMYSFLCEDNEETKRAKGVNKPTLKTQIQHDDYLKTLQDGVTSRHIMHSIRSIKHEMYSVEQKKISLCAFDDKRYLLDDGITSLAYGHNKIINKQLLPLSKK